MGHFTEMSYKTSPVESGLEITVFPEIDRVTLQDYQMLYEINLLLINANYPILLDC